MILGKFAAGSKKDKLLLNISNNGQSSSILELGTHAKSHPSIKYNDFVEVDNNRIDTMYNQEKIPKNFALFAFEMINSVTKSSPNISHVLYSVSP